jgi:S1-C subfamily serine protease
MDDQTPQPPHEQPAERTTPAADPSPQPAPYGEPAVPVPPAPPAASGQHGPGTGRILLISGAAALVFGAGGIGIGTLIAPDHAARPNDSATSFGRGGLDQPSIGGWELPGPPWSRGGQQPPQSSEGGQGTRAASSAETKGLVRIHTTLNYGEGEAAGTGMILTPDGDVVTNHHVVAGSTSIEATDMATGRTYRAEVVGTDAKADVALLRLQDASGLDTVETDTSGVRVGDAVTAVGDAGGTANRFTAAPGTVSATDQQITTQADTLSTGESLTGLIEITSDVAPGDSGGATYDSDGTVVGMTTAASRGGGEIDGYAVPIATVLSIVDDLDSHVAGPDYTYGRPAFLGVAIAPRGTTVAKVYDDTAAAGAGIRGGDRITRLDGTAVSTPEALGTAVRDHDPGDRASVTWVDTSGRSHTATVTLGEGPIR